MSYSETIVTCRRIKELMFGHIFLIKIC